MRVVMRGERQKRNINDIMQDWQVNGTRVNESQRKSTKVTKS